MLFAPLTGLEVQQLIVSGSFIEALVSLSINLSSATLEQVKRDAEESLVEHDKAAEAGSAKGGGEHAHEDEDEDHEAAIARANAEVGWNIHTFVNFDELVIINLSPNSIRDRQIHFSIFNIF